MGQYKAISLWQPWATYMVLGHKGYETRSWHPGKRMRVGETVFVHAAKKWTRALSDYHTNLAAAWPELADIHIADFGVILGAFTYLGAEQTEIVRERLSPLEVALGDYSDGRWAWRLEWVKSADPPIPAKGMQGIWTWEYERED